jgi:hypothetical protein
MTSGPSLDRGPAAVRVIFARLERARSPAERVQALGRLVAPAKWLTAAERARVEAEFARLLGASKSGEKRSRSAPSAPA